MTIEETQIVFAYEKLGHSVKEIAQIFEDSGETEESVLSVLSSHSPKYIATLKIRDRASQNGESTDEEEAELLAEYRLLSKTSDNDLVKERALKFLINEKKGRNDIGIKALKLKEKQLQLNEVDTSRRGLEFIETMKQINEKIQQAMGKTIPITSLEDQCPPQSS